jgi:hypothetical protein
VWNTLRRISLLLLLLLLGLPRSSAAADAQTAFLSRMVVESSQFRVRAQAALALASRTPEPAAGQALMRALKDEHPAVRAASASALERWNYRAALGALQAARKDRDPAARTAIERAIAALDKPKPGEREPARPTGPETYYVAVGTPSARSALSGEALRALRAHLVKQVAPIAGVRLAPENESHATATSVLRSKGLVGYYLDSSVTKFEPKAGALRAQVSVIVGTYPGRNMRVMLSGAATVSGVGDSEQARLQAAEAAFTGALRRLPEAMQAGIARAE